MDRVFMNIGLYSFRCLWVENLPIIGCDHESIVLHLDKSDIEINAKPFRCEEFWFQILGFIDVVKEAWTFLGSNAFQLVTKIQVFRQKVNIGINVKLGI